jgi:hypothetical protein
LTTRPLASSPPRLVSHVKLVRCYPLPLLYLTDSESDSGAVYNANAPSWWRGVVLYYAGNGDLWRGCFLFCLTIPIPCCGSDCRVPLREPCLLHELHLILTLEMPVDSCDVSYPWYSDTLSFTP